MGNPTRRSGRVGVGGITIAIDVAGRAVGVEVAIEPIANAGRGRVERAVEALFANELCQDLMVEGMGGQRGGAYCTG